MDHILPKGVASYARFTYERMNLAASCKRCNRNKLDLDILKSPPLAADAAYPTGQDDYLWVHPYVHRYSRHIRIREGLFFEAIGSGRQKARATAVIDACGLKTLAVVERRRAAEAAIYGADTVDAIVDVVSAHPQLAGQDLVAILRNQRPELNALAEDAVTRIVAAFRRHAFAEFERELRLHKLM